MKNPSTITPATVRRWLWSVPANPDEPMTIRTVPRDQVPEDLDECDDADLQLEEAS